MSCIPVSRLAIAGLAALAASVVLMAGCSPEQHQRLPALEAVTDRTSVSGISSGAYMAGQFQIAHSRLVVGAAIIAGGPYGCAESLFADMLQRFATVKK